MTSVKTALKMVAVAAALVTGASAMAAGAKIFVIGGKPDDPFWGIVKKGAEDAGIVVKAQGGSVTWLGPQNYDNLGVDAAELIRQAIAQGATGIVGPNWVPKAMDPAFKAVVDAKIPLVIYNAGGIEAADRLGAMNYVGAVDYKAGVAGGAYLAKKGSKNGVCVNSLPGAANIEDYCKGFIEGMTKGGGKAVQMPLPATAQGNVSAVDVEAPLGDPADAASTAARFPLFARAQPYDVLLGPGDAVFIPKGWWHYVRALTTSASVNFWW